MAADDNPAGDVLGIRPYGEAVNTVAKGVVDGAGAFLGRICLPAAEEFGLLLRDRVSGWRRNNAVKVAQKAEQMMEAQGGVQNRRAHPRLVMYTLYQGSWSEDSDVQGMWAGLLASSCTDDGKDESNLIFVNILSQLTGSEARILRHCCENAPKARSPGGLIWCEAFRIQVAAIKEVAVIDDIHHLDRELDHLHQIGVIKGQIDVLASEPLDRSIVDVAPTPLALNLYVGCLGSRLDPVAFFGLGDSGKVTGQSA